MSLFSWLFGNETASELVDSAVTTVSHSPDILVSRIQGDYVRLQELENLCRQQEVNIHSLKSQVKQLCEQLDQEKRTNANLQKEKTKCQTEVRSLRDVTSKGSKDLKRVRCELSKTIVATKDLSLSLQDANQLVTGLKFENEYLKCTINPFDTRQNQVLNAPTESPLPVMPFVLVLVDGDAYHWNPEHFKSNRTTPGAHAAQCLKEEIQRYLLNNFHEVPLQSKIIVRVICNGRSLMRVDKRSAGSKKRLRSEQMRNFMLQFSESAPLFDFFDAGGGKERADEKIKENFHLFITNPYCHRIFFACCTDNGFARLLEQYHNSITARKKIILVHPGYLEDEIENFKLERMEWPSVFGQMTLPHSSQLKVNRIRQRLDEQKKATLRQQEEGERKYGKKEYARILTEIGVAVQVMDSFGPLDLRKSFRDKIGLRLFSDSMEEKTAAEIEMDLNDLPYWDTGID